MHQGLDAYQATGTGVLRLALLAFLAAEYGHVRQAEEGLRVLAEAVVLVNTTSECWWEAELHRLRGELLWLLAEENRVEAEAWFHKALAVARRQQAKSLELRAAMSLARLWQQQGQQAQARALLHRSTAGSPRGLTRPTSRKQRCSLWSCSNNRGTGADNMERQKHDGRFHHTTRHYGHAWRGHLGALSGHRRRVPHHAAGRQRH